MKLRTFLYKLLFDRNDAMDALQLLFAAIVVMTLAVVWNLAGTALEPPAVKIEALITLRWLVGLLVITAVPKWMIPSMVQVLSKGNITGRSSETTTTHQETTYAAPAENVETEAVSTEQPS